MQFPFALFHNHGKTVVCSADSQGTGICQHKSHLATPKDHCLACSVHVEKVFLFNQPLPEYIPGCSFLFCSIALAGIYTNTQELTALRGPPYLTA